MSDDMHQFWPKDREPLIWLLNKGFLPQSITDAGDTSIDIYIVLRQYIHGARESFAVDFGKCNSEVYSNWYCQPMLDFVDIHGYGETPKDALEASLKSLREHKEYYRHHPESIPQEFTLLEEFFEKLLK